uniref:MSP domain-containing protein n=1 Tax=Caenorhabditis tropicalis TaxID=1561998 RepID=A0A1I7T1B6_9PELO
MDYLKPVLGTTNFHPINVNSIIPDGIVRERRQLFVSNDLNMTNGYTHKNSLDFYSPGNNKNKIYPIVNTRTPMRPAIVYYENPDQNVINHTSNHQNGKNHPYFVVKVRSHPPYQGESFKDS